MITCYCGNYVDSYVNCGVDLDYYVVENVTVVTLVIPMIAIC